MIEDRTDKQIAFYDRGLGTGIRKFSGLAFGVGIYKNIQECYKFVFDNFQAGDQLYLFGFSRGAYTVRSLAGFISLFGILPKSRPELLKKAYKLYKKTEKDKDRAQKAQKFLEKHHSMKCPIKFIGVWDTVGALGLPVKALNILNPFKHKFHDTSLHENVECGFHALSIDDNRKVFGPTFWDERKTVKVTRYENGNIVEKDQIIKQVWFPGVHTDIGGGYEKHGLSDITLKWMIKYASDYGLKIYPYNKPKENIKPDPNGFIHNPQKGIARLYRDKQREPDQQLKKIIIHQSVLDRINADDNKNHEKYDPWIAKHEYDIESW